MTSRVEIFPPGTKIPGESAVEFLSGLTSRMSHEERLEQVRWLAGLMDDRYVVPGTRVRFGWDSILGLFPGLGDALTSIISLLIVHHAWQTGASPLTLARMIGNVAADSCSARFLSSAISSMLLSRQIGETRGCSSSI